MIQKGAVQTTFCFRCCFSVMGFYLWFLEKTKKQKCEGQHLPHVTSHLKRSVGDLFTFFQTMGCCKSVHYDSKGCCSNNIVFLMFPLHYSTVISYNLQSKFSDVSPRPVQKKTCIYHSSYCSALFLILPDAVKVTILFVWHWCKYLGIMEF